MKTPDDCLQHVPANDILAATERAKPKSRVLPQDQEPDAGRAVRLVSDELDWRQLAILAQLSPTRRLQMMFDLCEFSRQLIVASERQRDPGITDQELFRRVRARIELADGA